MEVDDVPDATCSIDGCSRSRSCRGWCNTHYERWRKHGAPVGPKVLASPIERFWSKWQLGAKPPTRPDLGPCWIWIGHSNEKGYGYLSVGKREVRAHRFAYETLVAPIPEGQEIDHLCHVRACVNPAHLEPVTHDENMRRERQGFCVNGHELTAENLYTSHGRKCRTCAIDRSAARRGG